ncbi:MAG TPA: hypothetical protein VKU41_17775 [Polyangiaceae bacterium]|nr:hypothetical protein [Polyangiaceae bacterium]
MKRVLGHVLAGVTFVAGGGVVVSACAHDDSTLFVSQVLAPQLVANGNECVFTGDPTQPFLSSGIVDVDFRNDYTPTYLVGNQTVPRGDPNAPQTETSIITIQGAVVKVTDTDGNTLRNFTRLSTATIHPSSGSTPSYSPISVTTIDSQTLDGLRPKLAGGDTIRLVTYVQFFGKTLGGQDVESNNFEFPVDVCMFVPGPNGGVLNSCLIQFAPQDMNAVAMEPNCLSAASGMASTTLPVPCERGQDFAVDCSQCQDVQACHGVATSVPVDAGGGG